MNFVLTGFHVLCSKEVDRAGVRMAELVNRVTARGAERAIDLIDNMRYVLKELTLKNGKNLKSWYDI